MNKGNAPPPPRMNGPPGLAWRTYTQRARALNIPLRPNKPISSDDLVIPTRAVTPFAALSLNASVRQDHLPMMRPEQRYPSKANQEIVIDESSKSDNNRHDDPFPSPGRV
ncbi:hypothetical protein DFH28DRAFT_915305 [Melampsora americana]|nr:hypothetical protein DFH28DRAFT_915305 [Melampsora americana]